MHHSPHDHDLLVTGPGPGGQKAATAAGTTRRTPRPRSSTRPAPVPLGPPRSAAPRGEPVRTGRAITGCGGTVAHLVDGVLGDPTLPEASEVAALDARNTRRALEQVA